ncbi:MAG TPA: hypothetical protein VHQ46_01160 [Desulfobacteria bacterium]|nr:hypothetical protein [Desulfobacteria bacterium]
MHRTQWGRSTKNETLKDLQALAFWLLVIAIVAYLLFPGFFQTLFTEFKVPASTESDTTQSTNDSQSPQQLDTVFQAVYGSGSGSGQAAELSKGYWAVFVHDGQFQQLALTAEAYAFLTGLIEKDQANGTQKVILSANGQAQQVLVSEEVYSIISNLGVINGRLAGN